MRLNDRVALALPGAKGFGQAIACLCPRGRYNWPWAARSVDQLEETSSRPGTGGPNLASSRRT